MLAGVVVLGLGGVGAAAAFTGNDGAASAGRDLPTSPGRAHPSTPAGVPSSSPVASATGGSGTAAARPASGARAHPAAAWRHVGFAVTVTGRVSWVEVGVPGRRPIYQGLLRHGHTLRTRARPLRVVIGDAGAVRLVLHGRVHAPLGRPGQVLVFTVAH